jgi:hypothetical protein
VRRCRRLKGENPCALLAAFFLIEERVEPGELQALLGRDAVHVMQKLRWISTQDGKLRFRFLLYPLLGSLILTDGQGSNPNHLNQVYHLGADSHLLARLAPRPQVDMALDHCTGSGVHAVLAADHSRRSFGVDINPRALKLARLNARWNRKPQAKFLESDCYQNIRPDKLKLEGPCQFDLITANPPFVPTPETLSLCRGGGISGEDVTEQILRGLPEYLRRDGIFSMITNIPVLANQTFFERCEKWLGAGDTWSIAVLTNHQWTPEGYIRTHQNPGAHDSYGDHFERWLESYESVQLEAVTSSQVYVFRSPTAMRIHRAFGHPEQAVSLFIEDWLRSLQAFGGPHPVRFRIHPGLEKVWWQDDGSRVYLEWKPEHRWWRGSGFWLEGAAARVLKQIASVSEGWLGDRCDSEGLSLLLSEHLVTLAERSATAREMPQDLAIDR